MVTRVRLAVVGTGGAPVPHKFLRQAAPTGDLALVLPGSGYTADMPLLHYPARLLLEAGADLLALEYAYGGLAAPERERRLAADVGAACRAALAQRPYEWVTLLGKSLGTIAMAGLFAAGIVPPEARAIWLTPVLGDDHVWAAMQRTRPPAVVAIGTADPFYDAGRLAAVRATAGVEAVVVDGADHGLELPGDVLGSLAALERVVRAVQRLLTAGGDHARR